MGYRAEYPLFPIQVCLIGSFSPTHDILNDRQEINRTLRNENVQKYVSICSSDAIRWIDLVESKYIPLIITVGVVKRASQTFQLKPKPKPSIDQGQEKSSKLAKSKEGRNIQKEH